MTSIWPWLLAAGTGALHGLNPAAGWVFAAAWSLRSHDRGRVMPALLPIAAGQVAAILLVGAALVFGVSIDRIALQIAAGGLLAIGAAVHWLARRMPRRPASHIGLALWSFIMSITHGTGLMLVPALIPLCAGDASSQMMPLSNSLMLALSAIGLHVAAMLAVTGLMAKGACRVFGASLRLRRNITRKPRQAAHRGNAPLRCMNQGRQYSSLD